MSTTILNGQASRATTTWRFGGNPKARSALVRQQGQEALRTMLMDSSLIDVVGIIVNEYGIAITFAVKEGSLMDSRIASAIEAEICSAIEAVTSS